MSDMQETPSDPIEAPIEEPVPSTPDVSEPVVPSSKPEKVKKPRTEKQIEAFKIAQQKRLASIKAKKEGIISIKQVDTKTDETVSTPKIEPKKPKKIVKPKVIEKVVVEEEEEADDESSDEEEEVIVVKRGKKKTTKKTRTVIIDDSSDSEEEEPVKESVKESVNVTPVTKTPVTQQKSRFTPQFSKRSIYCE